jgi:transposase
LFVVLLVIAPPSQELEPPTNPGRFTRRHGLLPQQLFTWRREARRTAVAPAFATVALAARPPEAKPTALPTKAARSVRPKTIGSAVTMMEIEASGIKVRVLRGADRGTVAAIVRALKATS